MTTDHNPASGCNGKKRFPSYDVAQAAQRLSTRARQQPRNVYHCQHCHGYHIGQSLSPKPFRSISQKRRQAIHALYRNDERNDE